MPKALLLLIGLFIPVVYCFSQTADGESSIRFSAEIGGVFSSARQTPFWLRANQFGMVPLVAPAGTVRVGSAGFIRRDSLNRSWAFGYGVETIGNVGPNRQLLVPEAYVKVGKRFFELMIGRRKEVLGLVDTTLSSGSYAWSGNAIPNPKIHIGTNGFAPLKFTRGLIAINAFFAHGWFANTDSIKGSFLHQKAFYARLGRPGWKVKFYGGVLHNAQWGGRSAYLRAGTSNDGKIPSSFKDYLYVIVAKSPDQLESVPLHDRVNQFGNHLGSMDVGAEIELSHWNLMAYHQHPFEDRSGVALVNLPDGLYGFRLKRKSSGSVSAFQVRQVLIEYLSTMDQSGSKMDIGKRLYEGLDDYFNNFQYPDGWTHKNQVIGTPFLSRRQEIRPDELNKTSRYQMAIVNNRVKMVHLGFGGVFSSGAQMQVKVSYSRNYGIYRAPFAEPLGQFSGAVWLTWPLRWMGGVDLRTAIAIDQGNLYNNGLGGWLSFRKTFNAITNSK